MPSVLFSSQYFTPLFNPSFFYKVKGSDFEPKPQERVAIQVSLDDLDELDVRYTEDVYSVQENIEGLLLTLFGKDFAELPVVKHILSVSYEEDNVKYVKSPVITKKDDKVGLLFGDDKVENGYTFLPLVLKDNYLTFEGTRVKSLGLDSFEVSSGDDKKTKIPVICLPHPDKNLKLVFQIIVQTVRDFDYTNFQLSFSQLVSLNEEDRAEAWEEITSMVSSGISANSKFNQLFGKVIKDGNFPSKGVIIPITSVIRAGNINKKEGTGHFFSAVYGVDTSKFPPIHVSGYLGGDSDDIPLNTIGSISCGLGDTLGKMAKTTAIVSNPPTVNNPWHLYISAPNAKGYKTPEHTVFLNKDPLPAKHQKILEAQQTMEYWQAP